MTRASLAFAGWTARPAVVADAIFDGGQAPALGGPHGAGAGLVEEGDEDVDVLVLRGRERDDGVAAEVLEAEQHGLAGDPEDRGREHADVDGGGVGDLAGFDLEVAARLDADEPLGPVDADGHGDRGLEGVGLGADDPLHVEAQGVHALGGVVEGDVERVALELPVADAVADDVEHLHALWGL
jgi:hypothetical protein